MTNSHTAHKFNTVNFEPFILGQVKSYIFFNQLRDIQKIVYIFKKRERERFWSLLNKLLHYTLHTTHITAQPSRSHHVSDLVCSELKLACLSCAAHAQKLSICLPLPLSLSLLYEQLSQIAKIWFLHKHNMQCSFTTNINQVKAPDFLSVFIFSLHSLDASGCQLVSVPPYLTISFNQQVGWLINQQFGAKIVD